MATEQEELRLTVSLVDNASAGLTKIQERITGLSSGQAKQSMETFQRNQKEMGEQIKQLTAAAVGGERAMLGYIGRLGALGLAASAAVASMKTMAEQINQINKMAKLTGMDNAEFKNLTDQFKAHCASMAQATAEVRRFTEARAQMFHLGSANRQELIQLAAAGGPDNVKRTLELLTAVQKAHGDVAKANLVRQAADEVEANRLKQDQRRGFTPEDAAEDAAKAKAAWLKPWGMTAEIENLIKGPLTEMTDAQRAAAKSVLKDSEDIVAAWDHVGTAATQASEAMLRAFGPQLAQVLQNTAGLIEGLASEFEKAVEWYNKVKAPVGSFERRFPMTDEFRLDRDTELGRATRRTLDWQLDQPNPEDPSIARDKNMREQLLRHQGAIPRLAGGGIVNRATMAMVGEAGPEAVVPLGGAFGGDLTKDNTRETSDNTKELKMLNDILFEMLHGRGGGFLGAGGSSGGGGAGGSYGGRGGGGGGRHGGDGTGTPDDPNAPASFNDRFGDWQTTPGGGSTAAGGNLAAIRAPFMAELNADPKLKAFAIDAMQHEGGVQSNLEQLFNYAAMRGMTIREALHSGQYGPVNRGMITGRPVRGGEAALAAVGAGSNMTDYATDQGMAGDPNFAKYMANRAYYNMHQVQKAWFSYHGERGRLWAQRMRAAPTQSYNSAAAEALRRHATNRPPPTGVTSSTPLEHSSTAVPLPEITVRPGGDAAATYDANAKAMMDAARASRPGLQFVGGTLPPEITAPIAAQAHPGFGGDWDKFSREARRSTNVIDMTASHYWRGQFGAQIHQPPLGANYNPWTGEPVNPVPFMDSSGRAAIDGAARGGVHRIEANGKLTANITAPPGTTVGVEGGGVFKKLEVNRKHQMSRAGVIGGAKPSGTGGIGHA